MTDWIDFAPQRPRLWVLLGLIKKEKKSYNQGKKQYKETLYRNFSYNNYSLSFLTTFFVFLE
jgi:hypothetical protein